MNVLSVLNRLLHYRTEKKYYLAGRKLLNNSCYRDAREKGRLEALKVPMRSEVLNFLLSLKNGEKKYLEIGVRDPIDNYDLIVADIKYGVDPGVEYEGNPVDFKMTSDAFFEGLGNNSILSPEIRFDVIFVDGLHSAEQVNRDIFNSMNYISDDGFVVVHDCNPPTEWHARENYRFSHTPAGYDWSGTTWKAFLKWRCNSCVNSCCIDTDWGIGVLSKGRSIGQAVEETNPFFEYKSFATDRTHLLNLIPFDEFKTLVSEGRVVQGAN